MKILSMILTTLFFLGFVNIASAEEIYTITNTTERKKPRVFLENEHVNIKNRKTYKMYRLNPHECVRVTTSQFDMLNVGDLCFSYPSPIFGFINKCEARNYEIFLDNYIDPVHKSTRRFVNMKSVTQPDTGCTDIEEWMDNIRYEQSNS